jgi:tetratricopeptide (TPR) repeat protein
MSEIPKLALFMIVKNESSIIKRCLNSIKEYIDYIVITDTGSTDNTVEYIEDFLNENKIDGKVYKNEWKNFGHNRTKSLENVKEWLLEKNINLSTTYLITIDADMLIEFKNFEKIQLLKNNAWSLCQYNNCVKYYNVRIFRADLPYVCIGFTHEYWTCKDTKDQQFYNILINDKGDGGCKSDKFVRDIKLLKNGLESEPNNHRYYFYLAQSYADSGDKDNAIEWYNKRIKAGGWYEEIYISYKRLGEIYMEKNEPEKAIFNWLSAYELIPERSETLYKISNYYRNKGNNNLSLLFSKKGLSIPYPKDHLLFIDYAVYDYKFIEDISITSYYANKKIQGSIACQYLLLNNNIPDEIRESTVRNHFFYIERLSKFSPYKRHNDISITTKKPYKPSSACLLLEKDGYKGVVRSVNYSISDKFEYNIRDVNKNVKTLNYWAEFDNEDNIKTYYPLQSTFKTDKKRESHIEGLEDIRICLHNNSIYGLSVGWEYGLHNHPSVSLIKIDKNDKEKYEIKELCPITYKEDICQKNWTLFSDDSKLYVLYSHHPLTILEVNPDNGEYKVVIEKYSNYNLSSIRGSANPIKISKDNSWIVLIHEVVHKDTRKYYHRFLKYSSDWELLEISYPFFFEDFFIEFSLSIMYDSYDDKDQIRIVYSSRDNSTEIIYINYNLISWIPKDIKNHLSRIL